MLTALHASLFKSQTEFWALKTNVLQSCGTKPNRPNEPETDNLGLFSKLHLKPPAAHLWPAICISLETLLTSSWDRPSVRTTRTLGIPLLSPAAAVKMFSFTCWMARPDWAEGNVNQTHHPISLQDWEVGQHRWFKTQFTVFKLLFPARAHFSCIRRSACPSLYRLLCGTEVKNDAVYNTEAHWCLKQESNN